MAILTRPTQNKIFGSTALAAELTVFGTTTVSTDINQILNSTEAQRGWGTVGVNDFPPLEWFNALGYGLSYQSAYLFQQGIPQWTALQEYYINSFAMGSNGNVYQSLSGTSGTPNTGNDPVSDTVNWVLVLGKDKNVQKDSATGMALLPKGTTAQRPVSVPAGTAGMRYNSTNASWEGTVDGTIYSPIGGGATGGGADTVFVETSYTVTQNYTITAGKSAITVGDYLGNVYIQDDVWVYVPDESNWVIGGN